MSVEMIAVFLVLVAAVIMFVSEKVPLGVAALMLTISLTAGGVLTPAEGLSGFANPATVAIGCMFVISEGLRRTGVLELIGEGFLYLSRNHRGAALTGMMLTVGVVSGFINNTAAIAVFIPVIITVAGQMGVSPSKLLMPVSFASMFGGACTLIGTSTNILVSGIAEKNGLKAIGMFELTPLGLVFFGAGFAFMLTFGLKLTPARREPEEKTSSYGMNEFLTDVILKESSEHVGNPLSESGLLSDLDLEVLRVYRGGQPVTERPEGVVLQAEDVLQTRGGVEEINKLVLREDVMVGANRSWTDAALETKNTVLAEAVIAPDSWMVQRPLREIDFQQRFGSIPLAIQHRGEMQHEDLGEVRLRAGDCLLLAAESDRVDDIQSDSSIVLATQVQLPRYRRKRMPEAVAILVGVIGATALDITPLVINALAGAALMVLTGCLSSEEGYRSVNWEVIMLLAGVIPLGTAMGKTGAAAAIAGQVTEHLGSYGPQAVLSGFLIVTMLLTEIMNNQASATLLAPMVIQAAAGMDVDPRPLLMAVTYGASLSFMTPVGYQTNTLVYGPGQYKFTDYTKVGVWLNLIFWALGSLLIPVFWPF